MNFTRPCLQVAALTAVAVVLACVPDSAAPGSAGAAAFGAFENHSDVGTVLHAGSASYDPATQAYTLSGSGENMWFSNDDFQFLWQRVLGDASLAADISFIGQGGNPHRKAVLMIRQSLDADSVYVDVALHGSGLTSLQYREAKGAVTQEVQSSVSAPARLRLVKRGDSFSMWLASAPGDELKAAEGSARVSIVGTYYVGIGVCAHDKDVVERAVFSHVELKSQPAG